MMPSESKVMAAKAGRCAESDEWKPSVRASERALEVTP